jgi:predicted GH43/DUF377 family glycosyl hydrolase
MSAMITRLPIQLERNPKRVITRLFLPGDQKRIRDIIERVCAFSAGEVKTMLAQLQRSFQTLHPDIEDVFLKHSEAVEDFVPRAIRADDPLRRLIGAYFTMEYAVESAALFNPSMVPSVDQSGLPPGSVRFAMSLRATGEGHISSIVFRSGVIDETGQVRVDAPGLYSRPLTPILADEFQKDGFIRELRTLGAWNDCTQAVTDLLGARFTRAQLSEAIDELRAKASVSGKSEESFDDLLALTRTFYELQAPQGTDISEVVIFPFADNERNGIEDMRLVRFAAADGSYEYFGTYTAYNGSRIFPQLLRYRPNENIKICMLTGSSAQNKGMALFPRKIRDKYAMVARLDNENLYYMESDNVLTWDKAQILQRPKFPWEAIQIGNCGSPLETHVGWLLLTHGVGPMRQYCIGATLLDLEDPCRVIGQTREPLLVPTGEERVGYVPNVVYSCGGMIHGKNLVLPYAMSDMATSIALVNIDDLLEALR